MSTIAIPENQDSNEQLIEFMSGSTPVGFTNGEWVQSESISFLASEPDVQTLTMFSQAFTFYQLNAVVTALGARVEFGQFGLHPLSGKWGDTVIRAQVKVSGDTQSLKQLLAELSAQHAIELSIHHHAPRLQEPGLLIMDMDSTVIEIECIDEIAKLAGVGEQVSKVTAQAMQGSLPFSESLVTRVACLAGVDVANLTQIKDSIPLMPGIAILIEQLKKYGWKLGIASGGFTYFADHLKSRLSLDIAVANELEMDNHMLTGKVLGRIIDADVKAETVRDCAEKWQIPMSQTMAMGDGANDLVMMEAAALGVAFHAKPIVSKTADVAVRNGGLYRALYFLQQ